MRHQLVIAIANNTLVTERFLRLGQAEKRAQVESKILFMGCIYYKENGSEYTKLFR